MPSWTKERPCTNCGGPHGKMLQCEACKTIGCQLCIGSTNRGVCKVCKKVAMRRPAP